jgi:hypothetical protein
MAENSPENNKELTGMGDRIDQIQAEGTKTAQFVDGAAMALADLIRDIQRINRLDIPVSASKELVDLQSHAYDALMNIKDAQILLKYGKKEK